MPNIYIALLRAVNVGNTWMTMDELRELFATLRFQDVRTYIQSGNVVFRSGLTKAKCASAIAKALGQRLPTSVSLILKDSAQLAAVVAANPFLKQPSIDHSKLHVTFLSEKPQKSAWSQLDAIQAGADRFHASGSDIFLHCPGGYGKTKLSNRAIERALSVEATTRNWNTVTKLLEMSLEK